jgi:hypothetical protein
MYKGPNKIIYRDDKILKFLVESPKWGNKEVTIDIIDYEKIKEYRWSMSFQKQWNTFYVKTIFIKDSKKVYKQLQLKFPEKLSYFASLINKIKQENNL